MIQPLRVDVAALQQLPETQPFGPAPIEGGLACDGTCLLTSFCGILLSCLSATCGSGTAVLPD